MKIFAIIAVVVSPLFAALCVSNKTSDCPDEIFVPNEYENEILIHYISKYGVGKMCDNVTDIRCKDSQAYLENVVKTKIDAFFEGSLERNRIKLGDKMSEMIGKLREGWLSNSDLVVDKSGFYSAKWQVFDSKGNLILEKIGLDMTNAIALNYESKKY